MSIHIAQQNRNTFFFFTVTCYKWMQLIELTKLYDHIYSWFDLLKQRRMYITGYVIMPNHLHGIIYLKETDKTINDILGTGKRFMAYEIVKRLKNLKDSNTLEVLSKGVNKIERKRGKWKLIEDYRDYPHSSAGFYDGEKPADYKGYPVIHYQEVLQLVAD